MAKIKYKITIEYDGSRFFGWQKQPDALTAQATLENAIFEFTQEKVLSFAAGRTDTGVHALEQVVHFELTKEFSTHQMIQGLNFYLKNTGLYVLSSTIVPADFHARFSCYARSYKYVILNRFAPSPIYEKQAWHIKNELDLTQMNQAASYLIGTYDFSSFRATGCQAKTCIKTITESRFERKGEFIEFYITADAFLYHMVRNIMGTLKLVGTKQITSQEFKTIIDLKNRLNAGPTAPAHGLYFLKAWY